MSEERQTPQPQYYTDYLKLHEVLNAQVLVSDGLESHAHDEMLFIIIHQTYELWFKQMLYEVDSIATIMQQPSINDNSPELQTVVHRLERINTIMRTVVQQMDIMETMTPMDFLDFRDMLRPASGFQSWQFKVLEARLGLLFENRHGQNYYTSALRSEYAERVKAAEAEPNLLQLVNHWLERAPAHYNRYHAQQKEQGFIERYREVLSQSLSTEELANLQRFDEFFGLHDNAVLDGQLSFKARQAALFIMLYRGYPLLHLPFELLNALLELDEQLSTWRYRHMNMVHRMIGHRIGTGGSTGKNYLKGAADSHYIFREIAAITSFLVERRKLPHLPEHVEKALGFVKH